jgi:hypothetical protein
MTEKNQIYNSGIHTLGMGYVYVLLLGSILVPIALGYAGYLLIPEFKDPNMSAAWLMAFVLAWMPFPFLYFILCLIKQARIIPYSQLDTISDNEERIQIIAWNVPILGLFTKFKVLQIPQHRIRLVKTLVIAIVIEYFLQIIFLLMLVIIG